jgi:hypothetical protein
MDINTFIVCLKCNSVSIDTKIEPNSLFALKGIVLTPAMLKDALAKGASFAVMMTSRFILTIEQFWWKTAYWLCRELAKFHRKYI